MTSQLPGPTGEPKPRGPALPLGISASEKGEVPLVPLSLMCAVPKQLLCSYQMRGMISVHGRHCVCNK